MWFERTNVSATDLLANPIQFYLVNYFWGVSWTPLDLLGGMWSLTKLVISSLFYKGLWILVDSSLFILVLNQSVILEDFEFDIWRMKMTKISIKWLYQELHVIAYV